MPSDWLILISMGGLFIIIGTASFAWGKSKEESYYTSISARIDVHKYLEREPLPMFESLKVGGWMALAVGLLLAAMGGGFWLWG